MRVHIVQKGDTLWKIAKQYGIGFDELKRLNAQLANPDYIVPGMEIFLPRSMEMTGKEGSSKSKASVVQSKKKEEVQWKPTKEIQYIEETVEQPMTQPMMIQPMIQPEPQSNSYTHMPQMWYMPTYQQPTYQQVTYQPTYQLPTYQQLTYQPTYFQPQQPMHEQPMKEESTHVESAYTEPMKTEKMQEQPMYEQPMYIEPVYYQPIYQQPMYYHSPCHCQQPMMHHHRSCHCQQPMMHHHQPCHCQESMYPSSMYDQPMYYPMYQQVDGCEKPSTSCEEKEEQVRGYYEDIRQMENMTKFHGAQNYYPHPHQQWN